MKPMMALIATGVILLLVMLYFGNKYFDGVVETNVFTNADKYNQTAPAIIELEKKISNVLLKRENDKVTLSFDLSKDGLKYNNIEIVNIELTSPSKTDLIKLDNIDNIFSTTLQLNKGFYKIIFYILADNKQLKVIKTTYLE